ncbi:MAG: rane protein insertase YidC [Bacteroidota bacterium]|nr:rane protein insertase YidC [Bacteroidota bacterium]
MNFDRNTIIGIALIILIFVGFSTYTTQQEAKYKKEHPQKAEESAKYPNTDSNSNVSTDSTKSSAALTAPVAADSASYGSFGAAAKGSEQLFTVENENCIYTFSNKGGIIKNVELKEYKTSRKTPLLLFTDKGNDFNFSFVSNDSKTTIQTSQLYFNTTSTAQKISGNQTADIVFKIDLGNGKSLEHHYVVNGKGYVVSFTINASNLATVIPQNSPITLNWNQDLPSQEGGIDDQRYNSSLHYMNDAQEEDDQSRDKEKVLDMPLKWVSYKQKFFNVSVIAEKELFKKGAKIQVSTPTDNKEIVKTFSTQLQIPYNHSNAFSFPMKLYMGPNRFNELKATNVSLDKIIPLGGSILGWINKFFIIPIFHILSRFISNYGVIIFILALIIKLVTFPFTYKSTLSMIKMKVLKPEIDELKKKHPNQAEFGQKQMELYSQTGVSPFGGCLPMLLQMPILIAMYRFFPASIELRQQPFLWATDLSSYDAIFHWSKEIPLIGNHISLFTILMAISSIVVTKMTSQSQPSAGGDDMMAQQMKIMQYVMPVMLLFMFNKQPAALSYYYFLFNIFTLAQNWIIQKFIVDEMKIRLQIEENKKKPPKKSAFQEKMQEMMKQQQQLKKGK